MDGGSREPTRQTFPWWDLLSATLSWGPREESIEACAGRLIRWASLLEPIHPGVSAMRSAWGEDGHVYPLKSGVDKYVQMFLRRKFGFGFSGVSRFGDDRSLSANVEAGAGRSELPVGSLSSHRTNQASLSTVVKDVTGADAPMIAALKPMLLAGIEAWQPDWAVLYSHHYAQLTRPSPKFPPFPDGSWAIYIAYPLSTQVTPPSGALIEEIGDGLLMMATDGFFTHDDPILRAKAKAIHAAVIHLDL